MPWGASTRSSPLRRSASRKIPRSPQTTASSSGTWALPMKARYETHSTRCRSRFPQARPSPWWDLRAVARRPPRVLFRASGMLTWDPCSSAVSTCARSIRGFSWTRSRSSSRTTACSRLPSWKTFAPRVLRPRARRLWRPSLQPNAATSSRSCPRVQTPSSERTVRISRAASSSASPSLVPSSRTPLSSSWTRRRRLPTQRTRSSSRRRSPASRRGVRS